jgi:serine/threonine-protein kinase RsbW
VSLRASVRLPPEPWTLTVCRTFVGDLAGVAGVAEPVVDDLLIAVTEACSNVVRHAAAGGPYRLEVSVDDSHCVIRVRDRGPGFDPDRLVRPAENTDSGRGLLLVRAVMDHLRIEPGNPGTQVTMTKTLRRPDPG